MRLSAWAGLSVALIACGGTANAPMDLAVGDLRPAPDLSALASPIGGPCTSTANCIEGTTPVCFTEMLFNSSGKIPTPDGYCSSKCTTDDDCGANSVCISQGTSGNWCFASCSVAKDCRAADY